MKCAWNELLKILPEGIRQEVDMLGRDNLQELRLRLGGPPQLVLGSGIRCLNKWVTEQDLSFVVNAASKYSPWASATVSQGYITAAGGHRIGMCGEAVVSDGVMRGIRKITSLCIRVARDIPGIAEGLKGLEGNILILGPPGCGKTTLLRDLIRQISNREMGSVSVVDERGELFPPGFDQGRRTDVMTCCSKHHGLELALRTMGPSCIAMDEITAQEDCNALITAMWCGVRLIATAHAADGKDLRSRPIYATIISSGLFDQLVILRRDKSWYLERMA